MAVKIIMGIIYMKFHKNPLNSRQVIAVTGKLCTINNGHDTMGCPGPGHIDRLKLKHDTGGQYCKTLLYLQ